jgi:hypothetical protein
MTASANSSVLAKASVILDADTSALDAAMVRAGKTMEKVAASMKQFNSTLNTFVTLPLVAVGVAAVHAWGEQADAIARTNALLKTTGGSAGLTSAHMQDLAKSLEKVTTFSTNTTLSAMSTLLAFQAVRNEAGKGNDVFDRTVKVAQDLAVLMGRDLSGAMTALGRTMEDPEAGMMLLRRANVILSDEVKANIKNLVHQGKTLEAQKLVLFEVEKRMNSLAQDMAKTPTGQFRQAWNEIYNILEQVGETMMESLSPAIALIKSWALAIQKLSPEMRSWLVNTAAVLAAIAPLVLLTSKLLSMLALLAPALAWLASSSVGLTSAFASLWLVVKEFVFFWGLATAFTNAAIAGTGFTSVLWGLRAASLALMTAIAPFLLIFIGGGLLAWGIKSFYDMAAAIVTTEEATRQATRAMHELFEKSNPASAGKKVKLFTKDIRDLQEQIAFKNANIAKMQADMGVLPEGDRMRGQLQLLIDKAITSRNEVGKLILSMTDSLVIFQQLEASYAAAVSAKPAPRKDTVPENLLKAAEVIVELEKKLKTADFMAEVWMGFDKADAYATAYADAIKALVDEQIGLTQAIPGTTRMLGPLLLDYAAAKKSTDDLAKTTQAYKDRMQEANALVEAARTPHQLLVAALKVLNEALETGAIDWAKYDAARNKANKDYRAAVQEETEMTKALSQALHDMTGRALDSFVDMAFGAKMSFKEMVREMLADITKLIIKMELMQWMFGTVENPGWLSQLLGIKGMAGGGFLSGGNVALVGEAGPEFITAGTGGLTVTPMPAFDTAGGGGGGDHISVSVAVSAIDSQGVEDFFRDNEGVVASAFMRAYQRSGAMRRAIAGV